MRYTHRKKLHGGVNDTYLQSEERKIYLKERERERERELQVDTLLEKRLK